MSSWERIKRLPEHFQQQTLVIYREHIPIEVRKALTDWIDKHDWQGLNTDSPEIRNYLPILANEFLNALQESAANSPDLALRTKLTEALNTFKVNYVSDPSYLICLLRNCILSEQKIIRLYEESLAQNANALGVDPALSMMQDMEKSRREAQQLEERIKQMHHSEEAFVFQYQDFQKRTAHPQQMQASNQPLEAIQRAQQELVQLDNAIKDRARELQLERIGFLETLESSFQRLGGLRHMIIDKHLAEWQRAQQLAGNGQPFENNLNDIQEWCEILAELTWSHLQLIRRLEQLNQKMAYGQSLKERLNALESQIKTLLSALVHGTFVIEKQPPQVMKTNTRFQSTVRLLVGGRLNVNMSPPQVKVSIISEAQASTLARNEGCLSNEVSGEILNSIGTMEYHQATRQLAVSFRNMSLKKIRRAEKKGSESVMEEKFCLLFQAIIKVGEMNFYVKARSLPVVVIVHGNQESPAWATVTWDNAFSDNLRKPFLVPERVAWQKMAQVLSMKFRAATGAGLSESNLNFLATKALRKPNLSHDIGEMLLSWSQFCKEPLPERNFTFWDWFYAIMKLTREHLKALWVDGAVWGFVGRREAEEMLLKKPVGTFLLRFSDSEPGGVTIAWVNENDGLKEILMIQPFSAKDFQIRCLADRISDLQNLVYLYPDTPRDQAFQKYYTSSLEPAHGATANGYVKPLLVTQLPGINHLSHLDSNPATPASFYAPSESNLYSARNDASYDHNSMELFALNAGQPLKRQREDFIQQVSNWQDSPDVGHEQN